MKSDFKFLIASPDDREELVCQIYYKGEGFVELSQEGRKLEVEIYPPVKSKYWTIPYNELVDILVEAKKHLLQE